MDLIYLDNACVIETMAEMLALSVQELERAIKKAVKKEDYELAARLRDEISKRENDATE